MTTKELTPQLDVIIAAKRQYLQERKSQTPIEAIRALASMQKRPLPVLSMVASGAPVMLVGQIKYSAPQTGPHISAYDPVTSALRQAEAGADAVTLFTDETLYQGGLDDLVLVSRAVNVPVISQDYILDEYQIIESRAAGASALVLNASILEPAALRALTSSTQRNRMTAIVEVRDRTQLDYALTLSPYVIGLSLRDPATHEINQPLLTELRSVIPSHIRVMITDGVKTLDELRMVIEVGVDAVLVEEALLSNDSDRAQVQELLKRP